MTVTYITPWDGCGVKVPKLHRVVYAKTANGIQNQYQYSLKDRQVDVWLEENCKGDYYHSLSWTAEKFIEFEDSEDAVLFALRWS
jgi:hypothetical protein